MATINVNESTAKQLQELAAAVGMSVDEYVHSLVPHTGKASSISIEEFEAQLEKPSFKGPSLPADFSRADVYFDHD